MNKIVAVKIPVSDYELAGDWYQGTNKDTAILYMHGYPSVKSHQIDLATHINNATGFSILTFDYSGLGESPFTPEQTTTVQHYNEAIACYDWIKNKGFKNIIIHGSSYGGYLAARLCQDRTVNYMVLRAPAIYPEETFKYLQTAVQKDQNMLLRADTNALAKHPLIIKLQEYTGKALVVVHGKDDRVPKPTTDAYIKALNAEVYLQKEFYHAVSDPNNPQDKIQEYQNAISNWLKQQHNETLPIC